MQPDTMITSGDERIDERLGLVKTIAVMIGAGAVILFLSIIIILSIQNIGNTDNNNSGGTSSESITAEEISEISYEALLSDEEIRRKLELENEDGSYSFEAAISEYNSKISEASDIQKLYLSYNFARLYYRYTKDEDKAVEIITKQAKYASNNTLLIDYYGNLFSLYELSGNSERMDEYEKKIRKIVAGEEYQVVDDTQNTEGNYEEE